MALVTVNDYKSYYGITNTGQDATITDAIPRAQALANTFCGYNLEEVTIIDEPHDGGTDSILLKSMPVSSLTSITENAIPVTDYVLYPENGLIIRGSTLRNVLLTRIKFRPGLRNVLVSYVAGYTQVTAPEDLKIGIIKIMKHLGFDRKATTANKQVLHGEERSGRNSPSTFELGFLPFEIKDILSQYRMS